MPFAAVTSRLVLDSLVGAIGLLASIAVIASRWSQLSWPHFCVALYCTALSGLVPFLAAFLGPTLYSKYRTAFILAVKCGFILISGDKQVRLNQPPSGGAKDILNALIGLRFVSVAIAGMWGLPWAVWLGLQLALLYRTANIEQDCTTPLLSERRFAEQVSSMHNTLQAMTLPQLLQGLNLKPQTQLGQCKAAVLFAAPLCCILGPGLLLLPPLRRDQRRRRSPGQGWGRGICGKVEKFLQILRFEWEGECIPPWSFLAWWALLALLWSFAVLAVQDQ